MYKLDSFLKESMRVFGMNARTRFLLYPPLQGCADELLVVLSTRYVLRDHTFSNGICVPAGTYISVPSHAIGHDGEIYPDADVFDPWRFLNLREGKGEDTKHQFASTSLDYVLFGHGRHAWCVPALPILSSLLTRGCGAHR